MSVKGKLSKLAPERLVADKIEEALLTIRREHFRDTFTELAESAHAEENSLRLRVLWNNGHISQWNLVMVDGIPCMVEDLKRPTVTLTVDEDTTLRIYDKELSPMAAFQYAYTDPTTGYFYGLHVDAADNKPFTHVTKLSTIFDALRPSMGV